MSRYRVEESTTAGTINIYDSNGWIAGQIYWAGQPESERLKRYIEAHDEILAVLILCILFVLAVLGLYTAAAIYLNDPVQPTIPEDVTTDWRNE